MYVYGSKQLMGATDARVPCEGILDYQTID